MSAGGPTAPADAPATEPDAPVAPTPPAGVPGRRATWGILFAFLFAMGLGVTAGLLEQFQTLPPPSYQANELPYGTIAWILGVLVIGAIAAVIVYKVLRRQKGGVTVSISMGSTLLSFVVTVIVAIAILALISGVTNPPNPAVNLNTTKGGGNTTSGGGSGGNFTGNGTNVAHAKKPPPPPTPILLSALVAGVILAFVMVPVSAALLARRRPERVLPKGMPEEARRHLERASKALREGSAKQARELIIEAYGVLIAALATRGVGQIETSTPLEIEGEMERSWGLSSPAARTLRLLFEEARYSLHDMSDADRESAAASLQAVLKEVGSWRHPRGARAEPGLEAT